MSLNSVKKNHLNHVSVPNKLYKNVRLVTHVITCPKLNKTLVKNKCNTKYRTFF